MKSLLGDGTGGAVTVIPFFTPSLYQDSDGNERQEADVRSDVIIGADGDGNLSAVYTDTVAIR